MSRLITSNPVVTIRTHNIRRTGAGLATQKRNVNPFLADYNTMVPTLPGSIASNVSSIEGQLNQLKNQQAAYEKSKKKSDITAAITLLDSRTSQATGYINRLKAAQTQLNKLRGSESSAVKTAANNLYSTATSYINALNSTKSALSTAKAQLQQIYNNI